MDEIKENVTIETMKAQLVKMTEMYDELLEKYKQEIEKRVVFDVQYQNLYQLCIQNGWLQQPKAAEKSHADGCNCGECK